MRNRYTRKKSKSNIFRKQKGHGPRLLLLLLATTLLILLIADGSLISALTNGKTGSGGYQPASRPSAPFPRLNPGPFQVQQDQATSARIEQTTVGRNETLSGVLTRLGLPPDQAFTLIEAVKDIFDLKRILPGDEVLLYLDRKTGEVTRFEFQPVKGSRVIILKTLSGYTASSLDYKPIVHLEAVHGRIENTFWESATQVYSLEPEVVLALTDIFAFDLDFFTDIRPGDEFSVLYENNYQRGVKSSSGRILAAKFSNNGRNLEAYFYENSQGQGGYYNSSGQSLRKMFLKSPLRYRRISSYFTKARFHPILKIYRPHLGVDYAAPSGTPVETVADGVVIHLGWSGGFGRLIKIRHNNTYTTMYGHLSGYAKGLAKGKRLKQGDLIGYVGSSGLSTGPHLDFRMMENNRFIDPLKMKMNPAPPLKDSERPEFAARVREYETRLSELLAAGD